MGMRHVCVSAPLLWALEPVRMRTYWWDGYLVNEGT